MPTHIPLHNLLDAVVIRDFYKMFYISLGRVPNRCSSSIGKTLGLLSFSRGIEIRLSVEKPLSVRLKDEEDQLSAKHQLAVKGLSECKASESNLRHIQVKDIVKEVKDYLKTYSSAGIDIS
nr:hypothetical protein [Tanacetum cinerariifolium]